MGGLALFFAMLEDLRTREVPDWISFGLIFISLGTAAIFSIHLEDYSYIVKSVSGLIICVGIAYLMYYTAQWGGGDSKLLMAMGALFGIDIFNLTRVPNLIILLINIAIIGAIYGISWSLYAALRNWQSFKQSFKEKIYSDRFKKIRKYNIIIVILFLVALFFVPFSFKALLVAVILFLYVTLYLWAFIRSVEESCMIVERKVEDLVPGDWIAEEVKIDGEHVIGVEDLGISEKQIKKIKDSDLEKVVVREGVPFVPSFFIGYTLTLWIGNWIALLGQPL